MKLLKAKDVAERTSISVPHIRHMAREGSFPKPIQISANRFAWSEQDVDEWIDACIKRHKRS